VADLEILEQSIQNVLEMLERVLTYVQAVVSGEQKGDPALGRYLMDTLGASTDDIEKGGFNASLQVRAKFWNSNIRLLNVFF
jgi:translation initiation factor 3 subunit F